MLGEKTLFFATLTFELISDILSDSGLSNLMTLIYDLYLDSMLMKMYDLNLMLRDFDLWILTLDLGDPYLRPPF